MGIDKAADRKARRAAQEAARNQLRQQAVADLGKETLQRWRGGATPAALEQHFPVSARHVKEAVDPVVARADRDPSSFGRAVRAIRSVEQAVKTVRAEAEPTDRWTEGVVAVGIVGSLLLVAPQDVGGWLSDAGQAVAETACGVGQCGAGAIEVIGLPMAVVGVAVLVWAVLFGVLILAWDTWVRVVPPREAAKLLARAVDQAEGRRL